MFDLHLTKKKHMYVAVSLEESDKANNDTNLSEVRHSEVSWCPGALALNLSLDHSVSIYMTLPYT